MISRMLKTSSVRMSSRRCCLARMQLKKNRNRSRNCPIVKNGFLPFPTSLASGIPTIRCTDPRQGRIGLPGDGKRAIRPRQGSRNFLTYLYLFGDGKWFEGLSEYDLSGILMAQAEHTYVTDDSAKSFGLRLRHTYYDQAFDFSDLGLPTQCRSNRTSRKSSLIFPIALRTKSRPKSRFRQAAKDLTIHRKTIPINSSGSPSIGKSPKSSILSRNYQGDPLTTMPAGRRASDGTLMT